MHATLTSPSFVIPLNKQIYCFEISPYDATSNLFCAALQNKIVVGLFQLPVMYKSLMKFSFKKETNEN